MKKLFIFLIFLLTSTVVYSQCDETPTTIKLWSDKKIETNFQLCYLDSADYLIVTQERTTSELKQSQFIPSVYEGTYFLTNKELVIFTGDQVRFQLKLDKEDKVLVDPRNGTVLYKFYYKVTRSRFKLVLLASIESIDIIGDDEIQTFELSYQESVNLYQMTYRYFKWKNWK